MSAEATQTINSLPRKGRPPLNSAVIERAYLLVIRGATISEAARLCGVHRNSLYNHFKGRPKPPAPTMRRYGKSMMDILLKAIPTTYAEDVREEICQELAIEILSGSESFKSIRRRAIKLSKKVIREYHDKFKTISLSTPINESGTTLGEILEG